MTTSRYVLALMLPLFLVTVFFFAVIIELADLFANLVPFLQSGTPWAQIFLIQALFFPRAVVYGVPLALVFSTAFTLGNLAARNEGLAMQSLGLGPMNRYGGLLGFALLLGVATFGFQEGIAVPYLQQRETLLDQALQRSGSRSRGFIDVYDLENRRFYKVRYYDAQSTSLQGVTVVDRDAVGRILRILEARDARWEVDRWIFNAWQTIDLVPGGEPVFNNGLSLDDRSYALEPELFQNEQVNFDSLTLAQVRANIERKRLTGIPVAEDLTRYYERLSFAFTPLVVSFLAVMLSQKMRKHVVLMSLLYALGVAVMYYVFQLLAGLLAIRSIIPPWVGAFMSIMVFMGLALAVGIKNRTV